MVVSVPSARSSSWLKSTALAERSEIRDYHQGSLFPDVRMDNMTSYIYHRDESWMACMYRACEKHVVDLDLKAARTRPHDGGAGRAADAPGGPEVGEHLPKDSR